MCRIELGNGAIAVMLTLENEIKALIIEALNLEDVKPEQIDTHSPLFGDGLGLDSIDALELGLAVKRRYGIVLAADSGETRKHFSSVNSLAQLVSSSRSI